MRLVTSFLTAIVVTVLAVAGADSQGTPAKRNECPPGSFASAEELTRWGQSSAFGGGSVAQYQLGEHQVYVVTRMHTSGMLSSELSVYARKLDGKGLQLALFRPTRYVGVTTRLVEGAIVCEQEDKTTRRTVTVLTITKNFFEQ